MAILFRAVFEQYGLAGGVLRQQMHGLLPGIAPEANNTDRDGHDYLYRSMNKYTMPVKDWPVRRGRRGISDFDEPADVSHPVQQAWIELDVPQCGYCQSGQIMTVTALLRKNPTPSDADIDEVMHHNICRCGTYQDIRAAIHRAAEIQAKGGKA